MPEYYCSTCGELTPHLDIARAASFAQVTRATVYSWLARDLVHHVARASGRKLVCQSSLLIPDARQNAARGRGEHRSPRPAG